MNSGNCFGVCAFEKITAPIAEEIIIPKCEEIVISLTENISGDSE